MHVNVFMSQTHYLSSNIIGDRAGSLDEWAVWVRYTHEYVNTSPELLFFFDDVYEAERYKRDLENLISNVKKQERARVELKLKELLSL